MHSTSVQVVRMHGDIVLEWEMAEDRHVAVPAASRGVEILCEGPATALELPVAAAEVQELVAQRVFAFQEKDAQVCANLGCLGGNGAKSLQSELGCTYILLKEVVVMRMSPSGRGGPTRDASSTCQSDWDGGMA